MRTIAWMAGSITAPPREPLRLAGFWQSRVGLSPTGTVSLAAVLAVVVFVSLARLRPLMTHENEVDARQTVLLLAARLPAWNAEPGRRSLIPGLEELARDGAVRQALSDGVFAEEGRVLKRHGYLFAVVELPAAPRLDPAPGTVLAAPPRLQAQVAATTLLGIHAWPFKHGSSGRQALIATADGRLFRHANTPPRWSGPPSAHPAHEVLSLADGWVAD